MKKIKIVVATFLICLVIVITVFAVSNWTTKKYNDNAVVQQIKTLNRWETSSYTVEQIIDSGQSGNVFQQLLFGNRILLIAHGTVTGGFDLSTLSGNSISTNGKDITLNLPAPQILSTSLDESQTRVYDRQKGLLVAPDNNLESDARLTAVNKIRAAACSGGVLNTSSENGRKELTSMLKSFGFVNITINIPQGSC